MVFNRVVYEHCDVKMVIEGISTQTSNFISDKITNWNAFKIVWCKFSVIFIAENNCRWQIIQVKCVLVVVIDVELELVHVGRCEFFVTWLVVGVLINHVFKISLVHFRAC